MGYHFCTMLVIFLVIQTLYTGHTLCVYYILCVCVFCCLGQVESGGSLCEPCVWHSPVAPAAGYYRQDKWASTRIWNPVLPRANQGITGKHPSETCHTDAFSSVRSQYTVQLCSIDTIHITLKDSTKVWPFIEVKRWENLIMKCFYPIQLFATFCNFHLPR